MASSRVGMRQAIEYAEQLAVPFVLLAPAAGPVA
jgi:hypothetical protein